MPRSFRQPVAILLCLVGAFLALPADAIAGARLALVLGNSKYAAAPELHNPSNDAADIARTLRSIGFEVIEQRDANREAMAKAVREFSERLQGADVALFFYAGHGLQMGGENYLLPVDAQIETPADVRFNTINLSDIRQEMEGSARTNIVILDACRNNPFLEKLAGRSRAAPSRGLVPVEASGQGSLIVYSTQPNNVALDGTGRNSPFAAALLKHIATPGLEVRQMISRVRADVLQATGQKQTPWDSSSLVDDVYLAAPSPAATADQSAPLPTQAAVPAAPTIVSPPGPAEANGPRGDCERLVAPPPPFASPDQLKLANTRNFAAAIPVCEAAASAHPDDPRLQFLLGSAYDSTKNYLEALHHYSKAADAGYAPAQNALGVLFATGHGVIKDYSRAYDLFSKAAATNLPNAINNLGAMYSNGNYVKKDDAKALALFEQAIEAGYPFALAEAGIMYFNGRGTPRDFNAAAQYFQQAADLNDGFSLKFLAIMYERGLLGPPDPAKAAELRLKAARVDPNSQDPVVPPQKTAARRTSGIHYVRIRRYRFIGCTWAWC